MIMGLVGLCAVVGLRSRTELGVSMGRLMVFFMVTTAVLGAVLPQFIDNWGHAGGAVVGIALGFAHRGLLRAVHKPSAWGRGVVTAILIAACGVAQVVADRREAPLREEQGVIRRLSELERNYQDAGSVGDSGSTAGRHDDRSEIARQPEFGSAGNRAARRRPSSAASPGQGRE